MSSNNGLCLLFQGVVEMVFIAGFIRKCKERGKYFLLATIFLLAAPKISFAQSTWISASVPSYNWGDPGNCSSGVPISTFNVTVAGLVPCPLEGRACRTNTHRQTHSS